MPSSPEFPHGFGKIGLLEVIHQPDAEHLRRAFGNGGIAHEIAVDLDGKHHIGQHQLKAPVLLIGVVDRVHQHGAAVGDDQLQKIAPEHDQEPVPDAGNIEFLRGVQLPQQIPGPLNGTCHQLGEERDKQRVFQQISLGPDIAAVNIDQIAQCLEDIERDADRQKNVIGLNIQFNSEKMGGVFRDVQCKIEIFEIEQNREIRCEHCRQHSLGQVPRMTRIVILLPDPLQQQCACIGDKRR